MGKLKKNLTYQTFYQILITITPLITSPYLSRKLGAESLGIYSYTQSIVSYFVLFAMLGFINYGTRTIAMCKDEEERICKFNQIYKLQIICSIISTLIYILLSIFYNYNTTYMLLQSFWVISCLFDVTWYFFGKEEYKTTVIRNIIIKLLSICAILIFVHKPSDIGIYIFIMSFSTFTSQIFLWIILKKQNIIRKTNIKEAIKNHIKPVIVLFIPYLAMSVYHIMDKTMLGVLSDSNQNGYYYNSDKVVSIPLGIITGTGTVMLSKMSALQKDVNSKNKIQKLMNLSIEGFMCICFAFCFGLAAISKDFVPFFFGEGYDECILLISVFSSVIIFKALSNLLVSQFFIPFKKENKQTICVFLGAIINLILNYILIKEFKLGALGATIGTLIAEFIVMIAEIIVVNKHIKIIKTLLRTIPFILFGFFMFIVIYFLSLLELNIFLKLIMEITIGGLIYSLLCLLYFRITKNELFLVLKNSFKKN